MTVGTPDASIGAIVRATVRPGLAAALCRALATLVVAACLARDRGSRAGRGRLSGGVQPDSGGAHGLSVAASSPGATPEGAAFHSPGTGNFLWLLASRLFLLMPLVGLLDFENFFLQRSLGLNDKEAAFWNTAAGVAIGISYIAVSLPASRLSDRFGRKSVIYASAAIGAVGLLGTVLAPSPLVATAFIVVLGIGGGSFFAVDWALMTDIIPKAATGRYMGISNVVTAGAGPVSAAIQGVVMDRVGEFDFSFGPRAALGIGLAFLVLAALFLRPVDERRRED